MHLRWDGYLLTNMKTLRLKIVEVARIAYDSTQLAKSVCTHGTRCSTEQRMRFVVNGRSNAPSLEQVRRDICSVRQRRLPSPSQTPVVACRRLLMEPPPPLAQWVRWRRRSCTATHRPSLLRSAFFWSSLHASTDTEVTPSSHRLKKQQSISQWMSTFLTAAHDENSKAILVPHKRCKQQSKHHAVL